MEIPTHSTVSGFCGNQSLEESFCWQIPFPTLISIHKIGNLQTVPGLEIPFQKWHCIILNAPIRAIKRKFTLKCVGTLYSTF